MREELEKIMEAADELQAKADHRLEKQEEKFLYPMLAKNFADTTKNNAGKILCRLKQEESKR